MAEGEKRTFTKQLLLALRLASSNQQELVSGK